MSERVLAAIRELLRVEGVGYDELEHEAVRSAEEAARARGCPVEMGAKSIVMKTDDRFRLFVVCGSASIRSRYLRRHLSVRRTRFATAGELAELTGVVPGAVPPFGVPILPFELLVDSALLANERIAFTPGLPTISFLLASRDYQRVARPTVFPFTNRQRR